MRKFVVTAAFGDFQIGDEITDEEAMSKVEQENPDKVVAVKADKPKPDAAPARKS